MERKGLTGAACTVRIGRANESAAFSRRLSTQGAPQRCCASHPQASWAAALTSVWRNARANLADRAITAGRWEKLVYNLLKTVARDNTTSLVSYVSFRVDDYSACGPVRTHSSLQAALEE